MNNREMAEKLGIKVDGRWSESRLLEEIMKKESELKAAPSIEGADVVEDIVEPISEPVVETITEPVDKFKTLEWANDRAAKIWEGQSSSLTTLERIGRIKLALKAKGFEDFTKLTIPTNLEYQKYL